MVRKWSYINSSFLTIKNTTKLHTRFLFKIFRKNTRFKNYNQGTTFFVRKLVALQKRRSDWKSYLILASSWVNFFLQSKKLITHTQGQVLNKHAIEYTHSRMLLGKTGNFGLIGLGLLSLNLLSLKKNLTKFFLRNNLIRRHQQIEKNTKKLLYVKHTPLVTYTATFNYLKPAQQLNNLGFTFTNTRFLKNYTPLSALNNTKTLYYGTSSMYASTLPSLVAVRMLHTYLVLFFTSRHS